MKVRFDILIFEEKRTKNLVTYERRNEGKNRLRNR